MALTLERVEVARIKPLEDEYGNQFASRDYDLPANKEYVEELAASFGPSGEPDEPVKLIRDAEGGCYRVKAGNTRVRAMQLLGTEECWAVVDDEDTVQSVLETVVRTDKKKKYEALELSGYVQQLALFGDDAYVGSVAGISAADAGRMRRGREVAGDRSAQMTLDRLYALADFEGDDEAVGKILDAPEDKWRRIEGDLRNMKEKADLAAALAKAAEDFGVALADEKPRELSFAGSCREPDEVKAKYMEVSAKYKDIVGVVGKDWLVELDFYGRLLNPSAEEEAAAERRRATEQYTRLGCAVDDACQAWARETLAEGGAASMPKLEAACRKAALSQWYVKNAAQEFPPVKDERNCAVLFAVGYPSARCRVGQQSGSLACDALSDFAASALEKALKWVYLHVDDGWAPDRDMRKFLELVADRVAEAKAAADAGDGEGGE